MRLLHQRVDTPIPFYPVRGEGINTGWSRGGKGANEHQAVSLPSGSQAWLGTGTSLSL